jgi:hypothetical protein
MSFHLYTINELYSNADGSVQFIEMTVGNFDGQGFWAGHSISVSQDGTTHSFTFPIDLPSEMTANTTVLIATQGFANLGIVTPDFIIPSGFLFTNGGTVNYADVDSLMYAQLPTDGSTALFRNGSMAPAVATDFAGHSSALTMPSTVPPTSVQQEVLGLYAALYNRAADFPGYSFWVGTDGQQPDSGGVTVANAGTTAVTLNDAGVLGQAFVNTQATFFNQTYASLTDSQFINALYLNIGGNAGDPGGIAYWQGLLAQAEAGGASVQAARAGLVGQFVHDLIDFDLTPGATALGLTAAQYQQAQTREAAINDKIAVSLAYSNASQQTGGSILDAHSVGDAAFNASVAVIQGVTSDPNTVTIAITGINNVVAHQDLTLI